MENFKRIVVLGSRGQIGEALTRFLNNAGHEVIQIDIADNESHDLRIRNNSIVNDAIYNSDFVFFLAFDVGGSAYLKEYQYSYTFMQNNILIMENVFDVLSKIKKPFVFASSQMSTMNHSPYGVLKRIGEFCTNSLNGVNVRFWNVYGIESDPNKTHVITDFINMAKYEDCIRIKTTGDERRQFLYSEDASAALNILMELKLSDNLAKNSYDITSFHWTAIRDIAAIISNMFNTYWLPGTEIDSVQGIENEPRSDILDFWTPKMMLRDGIMKIVEALE